MCESHAASAAAFNSGLPAGGPAVLTDAPAPGLVLSPTVSAPAPRRGICICACACVPEREEALNDVGSGGSGAGLEL